MLELHVWGPAFGLPSIDAHCLAAIAYLQQAVPRGKWQLIASSDPGLSASNSLPALRNGDILIGGFRNIFHYIAQFSAGEWILDAGLPEQESADCIAFSSFVDSHGQPLLDLSLYVSSQNYTTTTRPLYNSIQSFPLPYLTPPSIRAAAKIRTAHLGLSSLDIDTDGPQDTTQSIIPSSLRIPKPTVTTLLAASPETNAQIRLTALAEDFFHPLQQLRKKKAFMVSDTQISSLDCLVLGYLSLMLVSELPQPWLSRTMREKFPALCAWTQELRETCFGKDSVRLEDAFLIESKDSELDARLKRLRSKGHLPWSRPCNRGVVDVGGVFLSGLVESVPVVGTWSKSTRMRNHGGSAVEEEGNGAWRYWGLLGSLVAGLGMGVGLLLHQGVISLPGEESETKKQIRRPRDMGHLGAALGFYGNKSDLTRQSTIENEPHGEPVVEVEVGGGMVRSTETVS
ncbi:related to translocase of outer mitochondrial membrane complex, subunit TOM37/Metaxin 1 [Rhynchosporium agropyri]|uniref:Related to translocase of outer mitochondrial membrane complex, subunit TOM37/Metaxin 1 n=1 Tax=Rhynchosporium agropyri TaxID=914238 RepID=A0A1E1LBD2_9HELO|nr:related to translocase of outer mitochondrial membrane complex, subunit TOM37/Metaxin 1 [Rhynchosporium agropyri]